MRNIRYISRLFFAFIAKFKGLLIIGFILGVVLFIAARFVSPLILGKKTQRIGITGRFHSDNMPRFILDDISEGLTSVDEDGTVVPSLSSSWQSPDKGKTWIFILRDDIYWHDGEKVTSETIIYEFSDVEIERPDDKTILFRLKNPFSPFPAIVSRPTFQKGLLGTGKFKVDKISIKGSYVQKLVISDDRQKITYKFYPTEDRTKLAYKLGAVDKVVEMLNPSPFDSWSTAKVSPKVDSNRVVTLFFNTQDPLLSEKSLRQALVYSINKNDLGRERAISPIAANSWAFNPLVKKYSYDVERATDLLDELPEEVTDNINLKLISTPVLLDVAEKISDDWENVGIKSSVLVSSIVPSEFQAYLTILDVPMDPDQYSLWHSTQEASNISKYFSPRIDKLLEDGRTELNFEDRRKIYIDFQRFLVEDSPAAFLFHPPTYTISRK